MPRFQTYKQIYLERCARIHTLALSAVRYGQDAITDDEMLQEMTDEELQSLYVHLVGMMQEVDPDELIKGAPFRKSPHSPRSSRKGEAEEMKGSQEYMASADKRKPLRRMHSSPFI